MHLDKVCTRLRIEGKPSDLRLVFYSIITKLMLNKFRLICQRYNVLVLHPVGDFSFTFTFYLFLSFSPFCFVAALFENDHKIRGYFCVIVARDFLVFGFCKTIHSANAILVQVCLTEGLCWIKVTFFWVGSIVEMEVRRHTRSCLNFNKVKSSFSFYVPPFVIEFELTNRGIGYVIGLTIESCQCGSHRETLFDIKSIFWAKLVFKGA